MGRSQLDCQCGGRFYNEENKRLPAGVPHPISGYTFPYDVYYVEYSNPLFNKMKCNRCGRHVQWKRRQPKSKPLPQTP